MERVQILAAFFMDHFDQLNDVLNRGVGKNSMTQIKDVPETSGGLPENFLNPLADERQIRIQDHRIEISLNGDLRSQAFPGFIQFDVRIKSDHAPSRVSHAFEQ